MTTNPDMQRAVEHLIEGLNRNDVSLAALALEIESVNGIVIEGAQFLRVEGGRICDIRVYFDTSPLLRGADRPDG